MRILVQHLDFPSTRIERAVLATCATRKYFCCSEPRTAVRLGDDLGGSYEVEGTVRRYYKDGTTLDTPKSYENSYAKELRSLPVGECLVCRGNQVTRERIDPLPEPFGVAKSTLAQLMPGLLNVIKKRPEYYSPDGGDDVAPKSADSPPPAELTQANDNGPFGI
jgi:hypothetical protein